MSNDSIRLLRPSELFLDLRGKTELNEIVLLRNFGRVAFGNPSRSMLCIEIPVILRPTMTPEVR